MKKIKIVAVENNKANEAVDLVAEEVVVNIFINGKFISRVQCSPFNEKELVYGYLFSEGVINTINDIKKFYFETYKGEKRFYVDVEKSTFKDFSAIQEVKVSLNDLFSLMHLLFQQSIIFKKTGCTHIAGLSNGKELLNAYEDISRRSAVQKALGSALLNSKLPTATILITSARINETILQYAERAGIRIVASRSAPTDRAVEKARSNNITLIGFLRDSRMNIYSSVDHIKF